MCSNRTSWSLTVVPEPVADLSAELTDFCGDSFEPDVDFEAEFGAPAWAWTEVDFPRDSRKHGPLTNQVPRS